MSTLLLTHADCIAHDMGPGHPEQPARMTAVKRALAAPDFFSLARAEAPLGTREAILRVHPASHYDLLEQTRPAEPDQVVMLDGDTSMNSGTWNAALRAVGAATAAVDSVMTGEHKNAFCATRPPGHHAEAGKAMGFCFFSNAAIAAFHARAVHGAERVAVVDFDVHHGNGTQAIFWGEHSLFYASTHQMPLYPGTGAVSERGMFDNICNVPLSPGDGGRQFRVAMTSTILPRLQNFGFDLLIISAGFDAHRDDPLGGLAFDDEDFHWAGEVLTRAAEKTCGGRVVAVLEGGYNLDALGRSAARFVQALQAAGA